MVTIDVCSSVVLDAVVATLCYLGVPPRFYGDRNGMPTQVKLF